MVFEEKVEVGIRLKGESALNLTVKPGLPSLRKGSLVEI
jgi:hypothetical protein